MFFPGAQVVTVQYGACERIDSGFDSWVHNLNGLFLFVSSSLFFWYVIFIMFQELLRYLKTPQPREPKRLTSLIKHTENRLK